MRILNVAFKSYDILRAFYLNILILNDHSLFVDIKETERAEKMNENQIRKRKSEKIKTNQNSRKKNKQINKPKKKMLNRRIAEYAAKKKKKMIMIILIFCDIFLVEKRKKKKKEYIYFDDILRFDINKLKGCHCDSLS